MTLNLYTSNRMELLVEYLSAVLDQNKLPPLDSETIIVQSQGMARFLAMELAKRKGVWAGGEFPFPNAFLQDIFGQILAGETAPEEWQRGALSWRIFNSLPNLLDQPSFELLASYCQTPQKTFQLSQQVSDLFDQYVLYRPEMIREWSKGKETSWQAMLWRHLIEDIAKPHRADLFDTVLNNLTDGFTGSLPKRISLFGISSMAPRMIDVFAALGDHTEVNVFFLSPCMEEWSQIMTTGSITRMELATGKDKDEQFLENGNELLASMAHLGRDYLDLILEHNPVENPMFAGADKPSLLESIQNDILTLQEPTSNLKRDDSLHFVSCHNGMREVEVLHDHLLHIFNGNDDVQPRDILVMAPDIGGYASLIDAVFRANGKTALPYSIADQSMQEQECFAGLSLLLKLAKGRFRVTEIMSLMEVPALCRRFGFGTDDLALVHEWLAEVHVHWGRDQTHRADLGLPPSSEHSFRQGINRLLLGFAMDGDELFMGILPFQGAELDGDVASKFLSFYEHLLRLASFLEGDKTADEWSLGLLAMVDDFFMPTPEQEWEITKLRMILGSLVHDVGLGDYTGEISPEVIGLWLSKGLNLDLSPYGFLSGGITFCSLLPMRAIPFKVVCLLGMNDGDFPRTQIRPGFDLTAGDYRKGDRVKRNDDRYLFLEALLSARQQLYISYVGRSIIDNREILPSVLVSELLEYVQESIGSEDENLVVQHPIQPFNPAYFTEESLLPQSYSVENLEACTALMSERAGDIPFLTGLKISKQAHADVISFTDVLRFWQNPTSFFCQNALGLVWTRQESVLDDDEPFALSGLGKYQVASDCVDLLLQGQQVDAQKVRASGLLPQGGTGDIALASVEGNAEKLVAVLQPKLESPLDELQTILTCGGYRLDVTLSNLYETGQVLVRVSGKIDGRHIIQAWLQHLVLQHFTEVPKTTFLVGTKELVTFSPTQDAEEILSDLLFLYQQGLCSPLPFFTKTSWAYAKAAAEKGAYAGLKKAQTEFKPEYQRFPPESAEPAIVRCFGDYTLDAEFVDMAHGVFNPLFDVATLELCK